jgi:hypothetical protein
MNKIEKRAMVLGNGPSLQKLIEFGLDNIPEDIVTVGLNAAYRFYQKEGWYPHYYGSFDSKVTPFHSENIIKMLDDPSCRTEKFLTIGDFLDKPSWHHGYHPKVDARPNHKWFNPTWYLTNPKSKHTGMVSSGQNALKFLLQAGYTKIYLIGIDGYVTEKVQGAKVIPGGYTMADTPTSNPNYFMNDYQQKGDIFTPVNGSAHFVAWEEVKNNIIAAGKQDEISIINLNLQSKVKTFPFSTIEKELNI